MRATDDPLAGFRSDLKKARRWRRNGEHQPRWAGPIFQRRNLARVLVSGTFHARGFRRSPRLKTLIA
ncbi:hypothetical protein C6341_g8399 [Phytophthora cactorum]|nr:hypothetical protein C6341_g8399 [Phytophthora cactorum]